MPDAKLPSINFLNTPGMGGAPDNVPAKVKNKKEPARKRTKKTIKDIKAAPAKKRPRKQITEEAGEKPAEKITGGVPIHVKNNFGNRDKFPEKKDKWPLAGEKAREFPPKIAVNRPGLYRKITFIFIILVLALLGTVFYFSFVRLKIVIVPNQENISDSLSFKISKAASADTLDGAVEKFSLVEQIVYPSSGEKVLSEEVSGQAVIYNNYIKNQPLVASTRLLAPDGKLFRIKQTVNIPAGGQAEVEIYADQPEAGMAVPAARFTIPGLWSGLQDKIYAETLEPIEVKKDTVKFVTEDDIEKAKGEVKNKLLTMAQAAADTKYPQYDTAVFKIDESSIKAEVNAEEGDEKENFSIKITADVDVVAFSKDESLKLIQDKVILAVPAGKEFLSIDEQGVNYGLVGEAEKGSARIKADFIAKFALSEGSDILDPKDLAGLNRAQLEEYLKAKEEIADYEIKFYPSFVQRVPNLLDRIEIEVLK